MVTPQTLLQENPRWGDQRIHGELLRLGCRVSAGPIAGVLHANGLQPVHRECRDHLLITGRRQLLGVLDLYARHDNWPTSGPHGRSQRGAPPA